MSGIFMYEIPEIGTISSKKIKYSIFGMNERLFYINPPICWTQEKKISL